MATQVGKYQMGEKEGGGYRERCEGQRPDERNLFQDGLEFKAHNLNLFQKKPVSKAHKLWYHSYLDSRAATESPWPALSI